MAERPSERDAADARDAERFDRYLDALVAGRRPSPDDVGDADEAEMARVAAALSGATAPADPDPAFVEQLRLRMRQADEGIDAVQTPPALRPGAGDAPPQRRARFSRRELLGAGLGTAAGIAAGLAGAAIVRQAIGDQSIGGMADDLVGGDGFWTEVALVADVPAGSAVRFTTPAFDGFVVNDDGEILALSSVCTHMGCTLAFRPDWRDLRCPCHGASFDLQGQLANGREGWRRSGGYEGDASAYPVALPPLVRPRVRVDGERVYVWTPQA